MEQTHSIGVSKNSAKYANGVQIEIIAYRD
jgi:hypothetical protein